MKSLTVTSISIGADGYPKITTEIDWDGMILKGGKGDGTKPAPLSLVDALNAFMPLVVRYNNLNDTWNDECGLDACVDLITFGETKLSVRARLMTLIDEKDSNLAKAPVAVAYASLSTAEQSQVKELRKEINAYITSLDGRVQTGLFPSDAVSADEPAMVGAGV